MSDEKCPGCGRPVPHNLITECIQCSAKPYVCKKCGADMSPLLGIVHDYVDDCALCRPKPKPYTVGDFDNSDLPVDPDLTPVEKRKTDDVTEHDHEKRIAALEKVVKRLEGQVDMQHRELLHLRKLMRVWVDGG